MKSGRQSRLPIFLVSLRRSSKEILSTYIYMEVEFRLDKCSKYAPLVWQLIKKFSYRLLVCFENKDKNGKSTKDHYHGYAELHGDLSADSATKKVRKILAEYADNKDQYMVRKMRNDTKTALAYCAKQQNIIEEYNTSYSFDDLAEKWKQMQEEWIQNKLNKENYKEAIVSYVLQNHNNDNQHLTPLDDVKLLVAKKMVSDKKLPSMGKVRSYALYALLTLDIKISELDMLKLL